MPKIDSLAQLHAAAIKNKLKHLILSMPEKFVVCVEAITTFNFILKLLLEKYCVIYFLSWQVFLCTE